MYYKHSLQIVFSAIQTTIGSSSQVLLNFLKFFEDQDALVAEWLNLFDCTSFQCFVLSQHGRNKIIFPIVCHKLVVVDRCYYVVIYCNSS